MRDPPFIDEGLLRVGKLTTTYSLPAISTPAKDQGHSGWLMRSIRNLAGRDTFFGGTTMDQAVTVDNDLDELEEDEATLAAEDLDVPEDVPPKRRRIFTDKSDPPITALHMRYKAGDLVLDPLFQRRKVWEDTRSSRLIESLLLEVPASRLLLS